MMSSARIFILPSGVFKGGVLDDAPLCHDTNVFLLSFKQDKYWSVDSWLKSLTFLQPAVRF